MRTLLATLAAFFSLTAFTLAGDDPVKVLIITGDHGHNWRATTPFLKDMLSKAGQQVDVTETPAKDLTAANLAKYDVLFLNYRDQTKGARANPDTVKRAAISSQRSAISRSLN